MGDLAAGSRQAAGTLTYLRIVEEVTGSGITQNELGQVVGASVRTVQNWAKGDSSPSGAKARRLLDLQYLVSELRQAYSEEGVEIWLHARNRNLGGRRPIDLLTEGQADEVLQEAQRVSGAM
jgi:transcriptional regulator with XRE-family HTH domain